MDLTQWLTRLAEELGVADAVPDEGSTRDLLDLTREAAHGVERVAGPLTTFLVGVAVGRGADPTAATQAAAALLDEPAPSDN
ncbi:DUF6457 domain-containing protein [Microlunatus flavus]|uniref:DUF6457 domain-containing protein n=1 Tax=Microlunatus flavus TaxID=1036181 RepID=A0A1H9GWJ9_9ACTN|nr:DUF6457 domain-containing protein [Microlunatus flavus]SEQ54435.1 hypothetical protein SAMN05421756_10432 [Microlunatus flavus]